jgi:hypothetical protein
MTSETTQRLMKLVKRLDNLKQEIEIEIGNLPNMAGECKCDEGQFEIETYTAIHEGNMFNEEIVYCLLCGGVRNS